MIGLNRRGLRLRTVDPAEQLDVGTGFVHLHGLARPVDHVAQVVSSVLELELLVGRFDRLGARVLEPPHRFPTDVCDIAVDRRVEKYLATIELSTGLLVLGAPASSGDQLDLHLANWGEEVPHHIAVSVANVGTSAPGWVRSGYRVGPVTDDGELGQVFMASPAGQIIELISRTPGSTTTFTCKNIAALSAAEESLRAEGAAP